MDAFVVGLKAKDRSLAKEWKYVIVTKVWLETELAGLQLVEESNGDSQDFGRCLELAKMSFNAAIKNLAMRAQYFRDIFELGTDETKQMAFLVEQGNDAVHSEAYKSTREALTGWIEVEAAIQLAKSRLK